MSNDCNCEKIIVKIGQEGKDGNGIVSVVLHSQSGLQKTYRISFTNGTHFDYIVTDGSSIASIAKTATNVLTDVYTITLTSGETTSFQVTNGRGITKIEKTGTSGSLTDVYTISFNDGTTMTYNVKNGRGITSIYKTGSSGLQDTYTILFNDGTTTEYTVLNGAKGDTGNGIASITKTSSSGLNDVYTISFTNGTSTTFTVKNGRGVATVTKTGSSGLVDTYRMSFNDSTYVDFTVTNGEKGDSATIAVGTVTTGAEGSNATVTNVGTAYDAIFNFSIPRGNTGNGIQSITLLSTSGLDKTYRITMTNGDHFDFSVQDGNGIASIEKTATVGAVDTYTVTFTDPTAEPFDYDVTNGSDTWGAIVGTLSDQTDLQQALDDKADIITESASGDIASFSDGADGMPVKSLSVSVEPVQDLHGYDNPWPAGGGANIWDEQWEVGNLNTNGTKGGSTDRIRSKNYIPVQAETSYYFAKPSTSTFYRKCFYDADKAFISYADASSPAVFTTPANCAYMMFNLADAYGTTYKNDCAINYPSTVTTYSPYSNVCPISGWDTANVTRTGICIWDGQTRTGYFDVNGGWWEGASLSSKNPILVKPNTQYYFKVPTGNNIYVTYWKEPVPSGISAPSKFISRVTGTNTVLTMPADCYAIHFNLGSGYGTTYNNDVSVNYPSTDTDYHAPSGTTLTIPFGQTVYGGTLDVLNGTLTVDHAIITFNGSETGTWLKSSGALNGYYIAMNTSWISNAKMKMDSVLKCNMFKFTPIGSVYQNNYGYCFTDYTIAFCIDPTTSGVTDIASWKTWLASNNVQCVYELATPIVITGLTPAILRTLLGDNVLWADCGAVDVTYRADTRLFVEQSIADANRKTREMMTTVTTEMKAPKNLVSGDIIIVNDDLYKATANIASGATLTVGTNVTKVTLAEWVQSLL